MSKRWIQEHQRDAHYRQAKREGYRARSAYKLEEINKRYTVIRPHDDVIDLGAAPGGWLQVIREITDGKVIGIDLRRIEPLENVTCIRGDMTSEKVRGKLVEAVGGKVNTIVSDMSPNISGNYSMDQAQSVYLGEMALETAEALLDRGGNFVVKVFEGDLFPDFLKLLKSRFSRVKVHSPKASRKTSSEVYVIARNYYPKDAKSRQNQVAGETRTVSGTEVKTGTQTDVKAGMQMESETEAQIGAETETGAQTEVEMKANTKTDEPGREGGAQ